MDTNEIITFSLTFKKGFGTGQFGKTVIIFSFLISIALCIINIILSRIGQLNINLRELFAKLKSLTFHLRLLTTKFSSLNDNLTHHGKNSFNLRRSHNAAQSHNLYHLVMVITFHTAYTIYSYNHEMVIKIDNWNSHLF